ncbi:MAG: TetR/AcrR family transcriptional regulator [Desulfobacteraceae bacterium]|nr:TetR/AcrR family transcriptional regulator [Pseudomonadota bacterium]MCG2753988.1 TetR/AcrR family transcriptional regulator [Desulfobacteraceae bacterium]
MGIQERKERERGRRRQQILIAAKKVFYNKGFAKVTMEDIAKEAELSPGTLYLYFKSKDELCASLSLRILQYLNIRLRHVSAEKGLNGQQKLEALKNAIIDVYEFDPLILINLFRLQSSEILKNLSPRLLADIKELFNSSLGAMSDIFNEEINKGVLIDKKPEALADLLWALFSGIVLWGESKKIMDNNKDYLKKALETAFEVFFLGIKKGK